MPSTPRPASWGAAALAAAFVALVLVPGSAGADTETGGESTPQEPVIFLQVGTYAHYTKDKDGDREGPPIVAAIEWLKPNRWYYGLSLFNNSFGQFSQFAYVGKEFPLPRFHPLLRARVAGGIVHGYKDEHEGKLPLNVGAFAPGIVPSLGFKKNGYAFDVVFLSNAAIMLMMGLDIDV